MDLKAALAKSGYRLKSRLEAPGDVVAPAYGLVGAIPLYTRCGEEAGVARALARAPEVDFAAWREGDRVRAVSGDGEADPLDRPQDRYPDLRVRVERGLRSYVAHPASVIVSLKDGWHYGSGLFDALVRMKGTPGSATEDVDSWRSSTVPDRSAAAGTGRLLQREQPQPVPQPCPCASWP